ncbi:hypothetical protein [Nonomuraea soli]|uniref:Uncharacterized protein n=1 Tax=Nonomuraea soli TaxID=1032476 RepID=A0A7W0HSH1_9ACTN|nr:hypothetical protein [Nonomuraea soli]MBA2894010.1 hypothetical protein [Nonomuraea soli]
MTDRIEVAATELRPLLEEFIVWARTNEPDIAPELVGPAVLWHRLAFSDDAGIWKADTLRELLLERMPTVVDDPDAAADGLIQALEAYLTFLSQTGRMHQRADSFDRLRSELLALEDDFVDAMEDLIDSDSPSEGDDEEEIADLGDFELFADELAELDTIRLRPDAELADAARAVPLLAKARDLALWVGPSRQVGEESLLTDAEVEEALSVVGLPRPSAAGPLAQAVPQLWNIWNLAVDLEFLEPGDDDTVSVRTDTADWPFDDDEDVLDAWALGLQSVDYADPELPDEDLTLVLTGLTRGVLVRLLLAGGSLELANLRTDLEAAAADLDELGPDAWAAATSLYGDPLAPVIDWLVGYGMAVVSGTSLVLTPLGVDGVVHLIDDADIEVDARPAIDSMNALDLLALSADLPEEEADAELAAWMELRDPAKAASELLEAATADPADALIRVQAASVVGALGEAATPAWKAALSEPSLRPYAATHLTQLGVADAPEPTQDDTHWLILDMWTISAGLGRSEFVSSLRDIGPDLLNNLLEVVWKIPHAHVEELLDLISQVHPDKQVAKAAKRALFKTRSATGH